MSKLGSATLFFVSIVLPLFFFMSIISIGLSDYYFNLQSLQKDLDQAAIVSMNSLPDQSIAKNNVKNFLSRRGLNSDQINLSTTDSSIEITTNNSESFKLVSYFQEDDQIAYDLKTLVSNRAQNVTIVMDTSFYLSPDPYSGQALQEVHFPAAQFITDNFLNFEYNKLAKNALLLTQQCFNPDLSRIKITTIELLNYYKQHADSDLRLLFSPGKNNVVDEIYKQEEFLGDNYCAGAALNENSNWDYKFPIRSESQEPFIYYQDGTYNQNYGQYLLAEETVWSKATSALGHDVNFAQVIDYLVPFLSETITKNKNNKLIFLFGDLPRYNNKVFPNQEVTGHVRKSLNNLFDILNLNQKKLQVYYLIIPSNFFKTRVNQDFQNWNEFTKELEQNSNHLLKFRSYLTENEQYLSKIIKEVVFDEQAIFISH